MTSLTMAIASAKILQVPIAALGNAPRVSTRPRTVVQFRKRDSVSCDQQSWSSALTWANSKGFGKETSLFIPYASPSAGAANAAQASLQASEFTPEQSKMVKESWKIIQKDDPGKHALKFFLKVFEIAPSVKRLFSFLKDSPVTIEKNPQLKIHALQVFVLTGQSAAQLGEKGALDALIPKLVELGHTHVGYGVVDEHFDVVKFALLMTLAEAFPDKWNPELKEAWSVAYDELVNTIKDEMKAVREHRTDTTVTA